MPLSTAVVRPQPALRSDHTFHIPVMGTGFSIDTPLRVAPYGISSVISLVDDVLIEQVRRHHCEREGLPCETIGNGHEDARAARITAYLDLVGRIVKRRSDELRAAPFEKGSEICRYYDMLPDTPLKRRYERMWIEQDPVEKAALQRELRERAVPGSIDVNIMTKVDCVNFKDGKPLPPEFNDAMSALRGFALSSLESAVVFSAGLNQKLYSYVAQFPDFRPDAQGRLRKRVTLKVSDYRSADIQGRFLAKRGIWVSEFRVESGLNCGGHAFATQGLLLGPILEEFKQKKAELIESLHALYNKARAAAGLPLMETPLETRITVQGGIGSVAEQDLLLKYYNVDGTGWGTPFLLARDVCNVDEDLLNRLVNAREEDVYLSDSSPLGVPFWNLRNSPSEEARRERIVQGKPGTACPKGFLRMDRSFGRPLCLASSDYQKRALALLDAEPAADGDTAARELRRQALLGKSCICHELGGSVMRLFGINPAAPPAVCAGPNIVHFRKPTVLEEMVGHIYGRLSLLRGSDRPHMFIQELKIYVDYLHGQLEKCSRGLLSLTPAYVEEFARNLMEGVDYYRALSRQIVEEQREKFLRELAALQKRVEQLVPQVAPDAPL